MFGLREEFRFETQSAYGGYCSYTRSKGVEPVAYHKFADQYSKGLKVKEIFNVLHIKKHLVHKVFEVGVKQNNELLKKLSNE